MDFAITQQDAFPKQFEVVVAVGDPFLDLYIVVHAFGWAVGLAISPSVEDITFPANDGFDSVNNICVFRLAVSVDPVAEQKDSRLISLLVKNGLEVLKHLVAL